MKDNPQYSLYRESKNILMLTYHLWESKRRGGFHYLAEKWARKGYEVDFVTYPYSFSALWMQDERLNLHNLSRLSMGRKYKIGQGSIHNFGVPSLVLSQELEDEFPPDFLKKLYLLPSYLLWPRLKKPYAMIVLESYLCILLFEELRRRFPLTRIVYRPSDPILARPGSVFRKRHERLILNSADLIVPLTSTNQRLYFYHYQELMRVKDRFIVLPNGIDLNMMQNPGDCPSLLAGPDCTAVYVGIFEVDWELIFYTARRVKDIRFVIVRPQQISRSLSQKIARLDNVDFINGVSPKMASAYIRYASIVILPYTYKGAINNLFELSSKVLQAMYFRRPIVGINISARLKDYGVRVCQDKEEFIYALIEAAQLREIPAYPIDWKEYDWERLADRFLEAALD